MRVAIFLITAIAASACGGEIGGPPTCAVAGNTCADDSDGDGLPDVWEEAAADRAVLDPTLADTDHDGTSDADEDPDRDGLTNLEELACARLDTTPSAPPPHPLRADLLVELDTMAGFEFSSAVLADFVGAYAALPHTNPDGSTGIAARVYLDEQQIETQDFSGDFQQRFDFFAAHGPTFPDLDLPAIPYGDMVHVVVAAQRTDLPDRTGETVPEAGGSVDHTGVFLYHDAITAIMPSCAVPAESLPDVTVDEALASTLVHEVGHTLQLGHDTGAGGGTNYYNVMSIPTSCPEVQMRFHGWNNSDTSLGNTEAVSAPRFSDAAAALIQLTHKVSADTPDLEDVDM